MGITHQRGSVDLLREPTEETKEVDFNTVERQQET